MTSLPLPAPYHTGKSADLLLPWTITDPIAARATASRRCGLTPAIRDELLQCLVYRSGADRLARVKGNKKPAEAGSCSGDKPADHN